MLTKVTLSAVLAAIFAVLVSNHAFAATPDFCNSVLQYGVFDKADKLDFESKYNLVKAAMCQWSDSTHSSGGTFSYGSLSLGANTQSADANSICAQNYSENSISSNVREVVATASTTIVNAWAQCVSGNRGGISHYFVTTDDPVQFTYRIDYTPPDSGGAQGFVEIRSLTISNAKCEALNAAKGRRVTSGGWDFKCDRKPRDTVVANLSTKGGIGTARLRPISLPGYKPDPPTKLWTFENTASANWPGGHGYMQFDPASGLIVGVGANTITGSENISLDHVDAPHAGRYLLSVEWAAGQDVPVSVFLNIPSSWPNCSAGLPPALTMNQTATGGWDVAHVRPSILGEIVLKDGLNSIVLTDYPCKGSRMPWIKSMRLTEVSR